MTCEKPFGEIRAAKGMPEGLSQMLQRDDSLGDGRKNHQILHVTLSGLEALRVLPCCASLC